MTVGELIDILSKYERGLPVLVSGYEGGYNSDIFIEPLQVVKTDYADAVYMGDFDDYRPYIFYIQGNKLTKAIGILR